MELEFTGERFVPTETGQIKYEHLHRYAVSSAFVANKAVLDIASGEGYGSAILAGTAASVIGVDIAPECVAFAQQKYSHISNLEFRVGSCANIPLEDHTVDVVTSFETIEHHDEHEAMMKEIKRVLKPGGLMIISSPDKLTYSDIPNFSNPYHVKELYQDELTTLLNRYFEHVHLYGQRLSVGSLIFPILAEADPEFKAYTIQDGNLSNTLPSLDSAIYFVALCSDYPIEQSSISSLYIDREDDLYKNINDAATYWYQRCHQFQTLFNQLQGIEPTDHSTNDATTSTLPLRYPVPPIYPVSSEIQRPLWSVMLPVYNPRPEYLEETLRSLLEQAFDPDQMQIEVVDDCSTTVDVEALVRSIGRGRIAYYRQAQNVGLLDNWNACIQRANGYWVHLLHQDDIILPGFYAQLTPALQQHDDIGAAFCRYYYMDQHSRPYIVSDLERETPGILDQWAEKLAVVQRIQFVCMVVRRSTYEEVGGFYAEARSAADWEMWRRIAAHYPVWYEPEVLACFRIHPLSESSRLLRMGQNIADVRRVIRMSELYLNQSNKAELSRQALEHYAKAAFELASQMIEDHDPEAAIALIQQGLKCTRSLDAQTQLVQALLKHQPDDDPIPQPVTAALSQPSAQRLSTNGTAQPTPLRIVVDGVFFQIIQTGIARVWRSLLEEWVISGIAHHIIVLDRDGTAPQIPGIRYRRIARYDYQATDKDRQLLQHICDDERADLFISTYYTTPLHTPAALLAYDMIPEVTNADLSLPMWQEKHRSIRYASHFLAISANTADDLSQFFPHIQRDAIQVAYCSVDAIFQPATPDEIDAFRARYGITQPYVLLVGMRNRFKNSLLAFQALSVLADGGAMSVVCVGPTPVLEDEYQPYVVGRTVHTLSLTDDELRLAYAGAVALVYPSRHEGFGLPILEAMACGCPVITCANSSIPEVAGEAALYVSEDDPQELAIALTQIQQPQIRDRCIAAGFEQVKQFSWARMAEIVSQTLATAAQKPLQPATGLPRSMVQAPRLLERYHNSPNDPDILTDLRQVRQDWVSQWMAVPETELEAAYAGYLGQIHRAFLKNRAVDAPLTDAEQSQLDTLSQLIASTLDHPQAVPALLAVLLYRPVYHLPLPCHIESIPAWVLEDYLSYLLKRPPYFRELGDAEAYYHYLTCWIDYLHEQITQNADDPHWQAIATLVTRQADFTLIYLANHNLRDLYIKRAAIMELAMQQQGNTLDYTFLPHAVPRDKLRLGILATHLAPQTETFATLPIFKHLNRDAVHIIVFVLKPHGHRLEQYASGHADAMIQLPDTLPQQVQLIREADLDILFIASNLTVLARDITLLALHRLARVQITGMNSPVTTGMSHMDYTITSALIGAGQDLQKHYRETLIALEGSAQCFDFGTESDPPLTYAISRADFHIPEDAVVYTSGANFFKITPELMDVWARILAQVPNSILLLYPFNLNWSSVYPMQTFRDRLTSAFARYGLTPERYRIADAAPTRTDVKARLKLTDIYLDSFPFAGMTSLLDPLELGIPTVVMEVDSACSLGRGGAFLRELQVADLIATDEAGYIQTAVTLGNHLDLQQQKRIQIQQAMQPCPSFLDSRLHAQQLTTVFEALHQQEQTAALNQAFRLRDCNAIAFPDWHQPEEELFQSLVDLLRWAFTHPNPHTVTLLIHSDDWAEEDANDAISSVVLHLMMEEGIETEDSTELVLVNAQTLGAALLSRLSYRIPLTPENTQAVIRSRAMQLPLWDF